MVADAYPNPIDDKLPIEDKVGRYIGRLALPAEQDQVAELDDRLSMLFDDLEQGYLQETDELLTSRDLKRQLEGDLPIGKRATIVRALHTHIAKKADQELLSSPYATELFGSIAESDVESAKVHYFQALRTNSTLDHHYGTQYRPVAAQYSHIYPQVHYVDRLRAHLSGLKKPPILVVQAAGDLLTIYGMSIRAAQRTDQAALPPQTR